MVFMCFCQNVYKKKTRPLHNHGAWAFNNGARISIFQKYIIAIFQKYIKLSFTWISIEINGDSKFSRLFLPSQIQNDSINEAFTQICD